MDINSGETEVKLTKEEEDIIDAMLKEISIEKRLKKITGNYKENPKDIN